MHKRTTPKVFARAKELRCQMTPAEAKLWIHLRAHRMRGVHFRNQHAIGGPYIVDFSLTGRCVPRGRSSSSNVTEASTSNSKPTTSSEPGSSNPKAARSCASGTWRSSRRRARYGTFQGFGWADQARAV
jgi:hypothetical protein